MAATRVCIFAKPPIPGRVKTRLAQRIGTVKAAELAAAMLADVWCTVVGTPGVIPVLAAAETGSFDIELDKENVWLQPAGDLGLRIENILQRGLADASAAIALGADTPLITTSDIELAADHIRSADAVLGPCDDGGFYLLGLRRCPSGLLADIPWSTEQTLRFTEARLRDTGMKVRRGRTLFDVDVLTDLERLCRELETLSQDVAPRTRKWIEEIAW